MQILQIASPTFSPSFSPLQPKDSPPAPTMKPVLPPPASTMTVIRTVIYSTPHNGRNKRRCSSVVLLRLLRRARCKSRPQKFVVRTKAIKGKGGWYWAHLESIIVHSSNTGLPKAVKLRCSLCNVVFSASNPSRTASEHLKRGTCPNFASTPKPISSLPSPPHTAGISPSSSSPHNHRKRSSGHRSSGHR